MKKILYLGINSSYSHASLAYGQLRAFTEEKTDDYSWEYCNLTVNDDEETVLKKVLDINPDILTGTLYLFNSEFSLRIFKRLKQFKPQIQIVLGGPEFLGNNEQFLNINSEIDYVIRGDETSFYKLLNSQPKKDIEGLCWIEKGKYYDNGFAKFATQCGAGILPAKESTLLDILPSLFEKGYFLSEKPFYQIETSRGCQGQCSFCTSSISNSVSYMSLERIENDIAILAKNGINELRLIDRTFNEDKNRAISMLKLFQNRFPKISFHLEINPAKLPDDLLEVIKSAPQNQLHIEVGIQSFSDKVLKKMKRYALSKKAKTGLKSLCELSNFEVHADLIAGLSEQTIDDVIKDLETMIEIYPDEIQLENLKILSGTPLKNLICENRNGEYDDYIFNPMPPYEILQTDKFSFDELQQARVLSKIIDGFYNIPELKSIIYLAIKKYDNFLNEFLKFYMENKKSPLQKSSLKGRFEILDSFFKDNILFSELISFAWLATGLSAEKYNLKPKKYHKDEEEFANSIKLWNNKKELSSKRYFIKEFNYNIGEIYFNPKTIEVKTEKESYIFYMALGNVLSKIMIKG